MNINIKNVATVLEISVQAIYNKLKDNRNEIHKYKSVRQVGSKQVITIDIKYLIDIYNISEDDIRAVLGLRDTRSGVDSETIPASNSNDKQR